MQLDRKEAVQTLTEAGCLVKQEALDKLDDDRLSEITRLSPPPLVVDETLLSNLADRGTDYRAVEVLTAVDTEKEKRDVHDFVAYYNDRYEQLKSLLLRRRDIKSAVSIARVQDLAEQEPVSIVGIVNDMYKTRKGKYIVSVEDPTGQMKVLVEEEDGDNIVDDEVIGVNGVTGDDIIFAEKVIWPDIPLPSNVTATDEEVYAAFISDIHFGSIDTLHEEIDAFVDWINEAQHINYLFIVGDVVEGVGTYPGQEEELEVTNIYKQYEQFSEFVKRLRDDIEIIICPGNHDMVRLAEPQPPLSSDVLPDLHEQSHIHFVPNPCYLTIHDQITVLLYHGYSFDDHVSGLPHLRETAYENPEHAMIDWLKRRHLAPTYGSNLLVPDETDQLVIDTVPDIFAMGHTHSFACTTYKGVNLVCAGTFQGRTDFQRRVGHKPDPGKIAVVNLQTRESSIKVFGDE